MENDILQLHRRLKRSKIAIFAIVVFLIIISLAVVLVSIQINQQAMTYQSSASEIFATQPSDTNESQTMYSSEIQAQIEANNNISNPTPNQRREPEPTAPWKSCNDLYHSMYPCVMSFGQGDPVEGKSKNIDGYNWECFKNLSIACEDSSKRFIPDEYKQYCEPYEVLEGPPGMDPNDPIPPGWRKIDGVICRFPDNMCVSEYRCDKSKWEIAAQLCGCQTVSVQKLGPVDYQSTPPIYQIRSTTPTP